MDEADKQMDMVNKAAHKLGEHFSSVLILCTGSADDGTGVTILFKSQCGNVHAHEGAVREWLREQEAYQFGYHAEQGRQDRIRNNKNN